MDKPKGFCVDCGKKTCRKAVARCKNCANRVHGFPVVSVDSQHRHVLAEHPPYWHNGYAAVRVDGKSWRLHRYLWSLEHGQCPKMLDHIDGDKLNCRIENLRPADKALNARNYARTRKSNLPRGVRVANSSRKPDRFVAYIVRRGNQKHLGTFDTAAEASAAYENARAVIEGFEEIHAAGIPPTTVFAP